MDENPGNGVLLTVNDCKSLYARLKGSESFLSEAERKILLRIEKVLYESFSISEMEELLERSSVMSSKTGRV